MLLFLKRNFVNKLFCFLLFITVLLNPFGASASTSDINFPVEIGDILTYQSTMTNTDNWTVNSFYVTDYIPIDFLKEDSTFFAEVVGIQGRIPYVQFTFKSSISPNYRIDKFLVYRELHFLENKTITDEGEDIITDVDVNLNINVIWHDEEVVLTQIDFLRNITSIGTYNRFNYRLIDFTSSDNIGRTFNLQLKSVGKGIFGLTPDGSNLLSLYWNVGFSILIGAFILKMVPYKGYFKKIKIRDSIFETLWMRAILAESGDIIHTFQKEESLKSPRHIELGILLSIGVLSNVFYRIVAFSSDTTGVIHFWSLFWGFLFVEMVRMSFWVLTAIIFSLIIQNKTINPLKVEFFTKETITRVFLYLYGTIMFLYFFSSWLLTFERDRAEMQLPIYYYGSLTKSFTPLFRYAAAIWNQIGWLLLLFWLIMMFIFAIRTFSKPTTYKLEIYNLRMGNMKEKILSFLLILFPLIWFIMVIIFEFSIIADLIYHVTGI